MNELPNASDRKSIQRAAKEARIRERQRAEVITSIMSTSPGRAWLWDTLSAVHIFSTTHIAGDALGSAFQEGQRSVGLALLADIMQACPDSYIQAMREANERYIRPDPNPVPADPLAERRGSPIPNGGDSGTFADQADDPGSEADDAAEWRSPGADIYTEAGGKA